MSKNGRAAVRQRENPQLFIKGVGANAIPFEETTEARDISQEGVSFYLDSPIWVNTHLTIKIASSSIFGPWQITKAMVVRVHLDSLGKQLIAARFDE